MPNLKDLIDRDQREHPLKSDSAKAREHARKAEDALKVDNLEVALMHYEAALRFEPNNADAHYGLGKVFHKNGQIVKAVAEYKQAITLGRKDFLEFREWLDVTNIRRRDWDSILRFAETLEDLIKVNNRLYGDTIIVDGANVNRIASAYKMAEKQIEHIEFDSSHLSALFYESNKNNHRISGIVISALVNKAIKPDEVIILDLDVFNLNSGYSSSNLGYKHRRGKLIIRGEQLVGDICTEMEGGEVLVESTVHGNIGYNMKGGKVVINKPVTNYIWLGRNMQGGEIITEGELYAILGEGMVGGKIRAYNLMSGCVGLEMSNGEIEVEVAEESREHIVIGHKMAGGRIKVTGRNIYADIGSEMRNGQIEVLTNCSGGYIGQSMRGGRIIIYGDILSFTQDPRNIVYNHNPTASVGNSMNGGIITISGSYDMCYDICVKGGRKYYGREYYIIGNRKVYPPSSGDRIANWFSKLYRRWV